MRDAFFWGGGFLSPRGPLQKPTNKRRKPKQIIRFGQKEEEEEKGGEKKKVQSGGEGGGVLPGDGKKKKRNCAEKGGFLLFYMEILFPTKKERNKRAQIRGEREGKKVIIMICTWSSIEEEGARSLVRSFVSAVLCKRRSRF